jgi:hypothetical protein
VLRTLIALGVLGWLASPAAAEPVGFFATLEGDVQVAPDQGSFQAARQDGAVAIGDRVRTAEGARARIVFVDDTMLHVDEDTEIRIESFHVGAAASRELSVVRQARGRLRTVVGDAFGGTTRLEVHTPTAVVGVKGTDFETQDDSLPGGRPRWRMCLHGGGIVVSNAFGAASPRAGYCVRVEQDHAPGPEFLNPQAPFQGPTDPTVQDDDFAEDADPGVPPPANADEQPAPDDLRLLDLPEDGPATRLPPNLSVGPIP